LKNSKLQNLDDKEKLPSAGYRKDSTDKSKNLAIEKTLKNDDNLVLRNSQIQIKYILNNKNGNLKGINSNNITNPNLYQTNAEIAKKPFLGEKKISETLLEKEKRILGNFTKIEKLRNLELKDLDSLEMGMSQTYSSNPNGDSTWRNAHLSNAEADSKNENKTDLLIKRKSSSEITCNSGAGNYVDENKENVKPIPVTNFNNNRNKDTDELPLNNNQANNFETNNHLNKLNKVPEITNNTRESKFHKIEAAYLKKDHLRDSLEKSNSNKNQKEKENEVTNLIINNIAKNLNCSNGKKKETSINPLINNKKINIDINNYNSNDNANEDTKESNQSCKSPNVLNPQIPHEYLEDIHQTLTQEEVQTPSFFGYMKNHTDINEQMRAILVDWIIEVHSKFNLKEETLFVCVFIIDKFLKNEVIPRSKLQLLGVASIMIACKQEEIYSPSIRDFVFITDNAYTKQEIFNMEYHILKVLEFNTVMPSSLRFYELIALDFNFDIKQFNFGLYLLELYLIDYRMTKYLPSVIACTAAYIVMKFFKLANYTKIYSNWNRNTNSSSLIKDCAREICFLVDNINGSSLKATKKKFSQEKYDAVSLINFF